MFWSARESGNSSEERWDNDKEQISQVIRDDIGLDNFSMVNEPIHLGGLMQKQASLYQLNSQFLV